MKRTWRRAISCCLVVVMCLTTSLSTVVAAEQASAPRTPSSGGVVPTFPTQQTPDISMSPTGELQGRLLDRNGQPLANRQVTVVRDHLLTAQATTDTDGNFKVVGKEGGIYHFRVDQGSLSCRVWTYAAAPPSAQQQLLLVTDTDVARGQQPISQLFCCNPWLVGAIIAAAIAIPIALHNSNDDDDQTATPTN